MYCFPALWPVGSTLLWVIIDSDWQFLSTLSLGSKAFIEAICPTPSQYKKKLKKTRTPGDIGLDDEDDEGDKDEDDDEDDDEFEWLSSLAGNTPINNDMEVDEDMEFDPGDLLGKVLTLIN